MRNKRGKQSKTRKIKQRGRGPQISKMLSSNNSGNGNTPRKAVFSDMADWNPAEIIGNNPNPLDYSLKSNQTFFCLF